MTYMNYNYTGGANNITTWGGEIDYKSVRIIGVFDCDLHLMLQENKCVLWLAQL